MALRQKRQGVTHNLQNMKSVAKGRKIAVNCQANTNHFSVSFFRHNRFQNFRELVSEKCLSSFLEDQD